MSSCFSWSFALSATSLVSFLLTAGKASHDVITAWMMAKIKDLEARI